MLTEQQHPEQSLRRERLLRILISPQSYIFYLNYPNIFEKMFKKYLDSHVFLLSGY